MEWRLRRHRWSSPHPRHPRDSLSRSNSSSVGVRPHPPAPNLLHLLVRLRRLEQRSALLRRLRPLKREHPALQLAPQPRPRRLRLLGSRIMSRSAAGGRRFPSWHQRSSGTLPSSKRSIRSAREPTGESRDLSILEQRSRLLMLTPACTPLDVGRVVLFACMFCLTPSSQPMPS